MEKSEEATTLPVRELLDEAKRDLAFKRWATAADKFGEILEQLREEHEEDAPILAPIFHKYGHALLEHAIATSGALGGGGGGAKDAPMPSRSNGASKTVASARADKATTDKDGEKAVAAASGSKEVADPRFTFGGDAEDEDEDEEQGEGQEGEDDEDDDLGTAFSVLELARVTYEKVLAAGDAASIATVEGETWHETDIKAQLAEVLNDLADVGLESENFQQASSDYETSLGLLGPLLQPHSRRLADAYLRLGLALEFHPEADRRGEAEKYVQGAKNTLAKRVEALEVRLDLLRREKQGEEDLAKAQQAAAELRTEKALIESEKRLREEAGAKPNGKGKGKAEEDAKRVEKDDVLRMDEDLVNKELKDVKEMMNELELKLEEYKTAPPGSSSIDAGTMGPGGGDKAALQQAINEALLGASTNAHPLSGGSAAAHTGPINDLSGMVKKKKKQSVDSAETTAATGAASPTSASTEKRKAATEEEDASSKKAKAAE